MAVLTLVDGLCWYSILHNYSVGSTTILKIFWLAVSNASNFDSLINMKCSERVFCLVLLNSKSCTTSGSLSKYQMASIISAQALTIRVLSVCSHFILKWLWWIPLNHIAHLATLSHETAVLAVCRMCSCIICMVFTNCWNYPIINMMLGEWRCHQFCHFGELEFSQTLLQSQ